MVKCALTWLIASTAWFDFPLSIYFVSSIKICFFSNAENHKWITHQFSLLTWSPNPGVSVIDNRNLTFFSSITAREICTVTTWKSWSKLKYCLGRMVRWPCAKIQGVMVNYGQSVTTQPPKFASNFTIKYILKAQKSCRYKLHWVTVNTGTMSYSFIYIELQCYLPWVTVLFTMSYSITYRELKYYLGRELQCYLPWVTVLLTMSYSITYRELQC